MSVSVIEQAKIQAQVLVPLVKALQAELGEARANALVRKALGDLYRGFGEEFWKAKTPNASKTDLGTAISSAFKTYSRDDALAYDVIEQSKDAFAFDVKRCAYAEFYKALGEPELGLSPGLHCRPCDRRRLWPRYQAGAHANHYARRASLRLPLQAGYRRITVRSPIAGSAG